MSAPESQRPALDELLDEVLAAEQVDGESERAGQARRRWAAMLGSLESVAVPPEGLADLAMLRVLRSDEDGELTTLDAEAVDAMMASGFDERRVPRGLRSRAAALGGLGRSLLTGGPEPSRDLTDRTMRKIETADAAPVALPMRVQAHQRFSDLISIAAMLLLMVSIGWPALAAWRNTSMRAVCESNMRSVASAMGLYGGDFREHLPAANAGFGGGQTWWNVGQGAEQSNSANLYTLTRAGYAPVSDLACPGNGHALTEAHDDQAVDWRSFDEVSYSYRIITRSATPRLGVDERFVIAADRSPVVVRASRGEPILPHENSMNHSGTGQMVLFSDGSVQWLRSPELDSGENIYLPRAIEIMVAVARQMNRMEPIRGTELPARRGDNFVGP